MSWRPFSLHFREIYELGFRYLDRCGEFMVHASEELDLISAEIKVSGATLELPEHGIKIAVDSQELVATQEDPTDDNEIFITTCERIKELVNQYFAPKRITSVGWASKTFWACPSPEAALKATLKLGGGFQSELEKVFNMPASHKRLDYSFASGSYDLHLVLEPVTFERVSRAYFNPAFRATDEQRRRIERFNRKAERMHRPPGHAVMMELNLVENNPPESAPIRKHFDELRKKEHTAQTTFTIK
jgi:hypothetical protein